MNYIKMTMAQALVKFLDNQYVSFNGEETKFVDGVFTVFGHGIVCGLGQALGENPGGLKVYQGRNEQGMAHVATGFAKEHNRRKIIACASSIGPGAANMVTAVATATVNNIPLLVFTGDTHATRQPDPVLQQLEQPYDLSITTSDAFRPVSRYWDRIHRPEQLMSAMINAMRVLTDPAHTGGVCISIPQDVQGESYDYPEYFFNKRVHKIPQPTAEIDTVLEAVKIISKKKKPLVICGGGVRYSQAGKTLETFCEKFNIPFSETQAGKSACLSSHAYNLGGIGVTGNSASNTVVKEADLIIAVGSRLSDFTTASKSAFKDEDTQFITINMSQYHGNKMDAVSLVGDADKTLKVLMEELLKINYKSSYIDEIKTAKNLWQEEMKRLTNYKYCDNFEPLVKARNEKTIDEFVKLTGGVLTQTQALGIIREKIANDAIVVGASGSLPGDLQRMWETDARDTYHMEYGYSCMGYEIQAALGAKMAKPDTEVYSMVGDGSFIMLHSELTTSLQENKKIIVLLFDNCGFGCINNLQMGQGMDSLATEFRYRTESGAQDGALIETDFAMIAKGYGLNAYSAKNEEELINAIEMAREDNKSVLIDIKVLPKTMTDGYGAWWNVGVASVSEIETVNKAYNDKTENFNTARKY